MADDADEVDPAEAPLEDAWDAWASPPPGLSGGGWPDQDFVLNAELASHAYSASTAAFHADIAVQNAARLAYCVQCLQLTIADLRHKISDLEQWKKTALEDVRKLREEHKEIQICLIRRLGRDASGLPAKSKSAPNMLLEADSREAEPSPSPSSLLPHGQSFSSFTGFDADTEGGNFEGIVVVEGQVDGSPCVRAEWRIGNLSMKLRGCKGRALVSSPFAAAGLQDLRLMVCPDGKDGVGNDRRSRAQKELYVKKVTEGPLDASLRLKAPSSSSVNGPSEIQYFLKVGSKRMGPFRHNFAENTVSGCDSFGVDWLRQLDSDQSLLVCVEVLVDAPPVLAQDSPAP